MSESKRKIFISYRRDDHPDFVERIRDWFVQRYGRENVFMDFDTIPPSARFADFIQEKVRESDVLIAIIGPRWMDLMREKASRFQEDYVRIEIGLALQEKKLIAPICIKGASIPSINELPSDLREMLNYNVAHLNSGTAFLDNIGRIVEAVEQELVSRGSPPQPISQTNSSNAIAYLGRAMNRQRAGDLEGALADCNEVIRLEPERTDGYVLRAMLYQAKGKVDQGIDDCNRAISLDPNHAEVYALRATLRQAKGDWEGATEDWNKSIHLEQIGKLTKK